MAEESHEKADSTPASSNFETVDPDAGSKLIVEKVTQVAATVEGSEANIAEKLIQRFRDLLGQNTNKIEGGQMLAGSDDVDRLLGDTLRRKLAQAGQ